MLAVYIAVHCIKLLYQCHSTAGAHLRASATTSTAVLTSLLVPQNGMPLAKCATLTVLPSDPHIVVAPV